MKILEFHVKKTDISNERAEKQRSGWLLLMTKLRLRDRLSAAEQGDKKKLTNARQGLREVFRLSVPRYPRQLADSTAVAQHFGLPLIQFLLHARCALLLLAYCCCCWLHSTTPHISASGPLTQYNMVVSACARV